MNSQIEAKMIYFGSGPISDLDRFVNGTDYFGGGLYDFEPHC